MVFCIALWSLSSNYDTGRPRMQAASFSCNCLWSRVSFDTRILSYPRSVRSSRCLETCEVFGSVNSHVLDSSAFARGLGKKELVTYQPNTSFHLAFLSLASVFQMFDSCL
jgi:hypothetical protein